MATEPDTGIDDRTAHSATQAFGLALLTGTLALVVVVSLIVFGGDDVAVFLVPGVVLAVATLITWRQDRQWARGVGLAATVLSLGGFFLAFGVFQPFSPIEFILGVSYVLGVVLSLVAGIRALLAGRAGHTEPAGAHNRTQRYVLGLIGVFAVVSIVGFLTTRQTVSAEDAAGAVVLDMVDFEFEPQMASVPTGGKLLIKNSDPLVHDFKFDELGIKVVIRPGSESLVDLSELDPGVYDYFCSLHSDGTSGMKGSFSVAG
jgi:plastocyanin